MLFLFSLSTMCPTMCVSSSKKKKNSISIRRKNIRTFVTIFEFLLFFFLGVSFFLLYSLSLSFPPSLPPHPCMYIDILRVRYLSLSLLDVNECHSAGFITLSFALLLVIVSSVYMLVKTEEEEEEEEEE
eukprot:Rmarinus@m.15485